jgi:hypothetical protein
MIDEIIKKLSSAVVIRNQNTSHVKMMLKSAKLIRANEALSVDQIRKFDWIIDELSIQIIDLSERDKIKEEIKKEKGLVSVAKDIHKFTMKLDGNVNSIEKESKVPIGTLRDAAISDDIFNIIIKTLIDKRVIDEQLSLISTSDSLYGIIKRFKKMGYFNRITNEKLHPLVNIAFSTNSVFQTFKQADIYRVIE